MEKGRYPQAVFLRRGAGAGTGYGFFYANKKDFDEAVQAFQRPILKRIIDKLGAANEEAEQRRLQAINSFVAQAIEGGLAPGSGLPQEGVRWVLAAAVRETYRAHNSAGAAGTPRIVMVEPTSGSEAAFKVRAAPEFIKQTGWPRAVVEGTPAEGGPARFFDSERDWQAAGQKAPRDGAWLVPIIYRLYSRTPSVMVGRPVEQSGGGVGVECRPMAFSHDAELKER